LGAGRRADINWVSTTVPERRAGQYAKERFELRCRAWRRRIWWLLPLAALSIALPMLAIGALADREHISFWSGVAVGGGLVFAISLWMSPPARIENWRTGAEGERKTAKALRTLTRGGWVLVNDIPWRDRGNIDHVLIGPAGVFVLETKNLGGEGRVSAGRLTIRHPDEDDSIRRLPDFGGIARRQATEVRNELAEAGVELSQVDALVVLWCRFEQGTVDEPRTTWIHGSRLVDHLDGLPHQLDADTVDRIRVLFTEGA
jgi:hypothetical protein